MNVAEATRRASPRAPGGPAPWRLSRGWRRTTLVVHVVSAGAWIGIDVMVAVLVLAGRLGTTPTRSLAYQALGTFVVWPMLTAGLVCLLTGLVLGLGTKWGLFRYWWVVVKLVLNLALCALILVLLEPGMAEIVAWGMALPEGGRQPRFINTLFFPPAVSLTTLTFATTLAVVKPWGRTGTGARRGKA
jgi:hypothetical protein